MYFAGKYIKNGDASEDGVDWVIINQYEFGFHSSLLPSKGCNIESWRVDEITNSGRILVNENTGEVKVKRGYPGIYRFTLTACTDGVGDDLVNDDSTVNKRCRTLEKTFEVTLRLPCKKILIINWNYS